MLPTLTLLAGLLIGAGTVWLLSREQLRGMSALVGAAQARDELHDRALARQDATLRELAHKISAPEQASIDHVFLQERARREEKEAREQAERQARRLDAELASRGIDPSEVADPAALMVP